MHGKKLLSMIAGKSPTVTTFPTYSLCPSLNLELWSWNEVMSAGAYFLELMGFFRTRTDEIHLGILAL